MGDFVSFTVVTSGPDPAGKKQARLPFHRSRDGTCVTSCSATQLPDSSLLVFPAAVLFHLLTLSARQLLADTRLSRDGDRPAVSNSASATPLEFLPGVRISVTVGRACEQMAVSVFDLSPSRVQLVSVPSVKETLQQIASSLLQHDGEPWQHGWLAARTTIEPQLTGLFCCVSTEALTPVPQLPPRGAAETNARASVPHAASATRCLQSSAEALADGTSPVGTAQRAQSVVLAGTSVVVVGSPFGCLQPDLLCNSVRKGHVANSFTLFRRAQSSLGLSGWDRPSTNASNLQLSDEDALLDTIYGAPVAGRDLLLLDFKGLPGMEGATVLLPGGAPVAVLLPPLRHKGLGVDLHFAVTLQALSSAIRRQLPRISGTARCSAMHASAPSPEKRPPRPVADQHEAVSAIQESVHRAQCTAADAAAIPVGAAAPREGLDRSAASTAGHQRVPFECVAAACLRATVLVQSGTSWATGVVLDADTGLVLTNAHAVKASMSPPQISWTDPESLQRHRWPAVVLWASRHSVGLDVAILQMQGDAQLRMVGARSARAANVRMHWNDVNQLPDAWAVVAPTNQPVPAGCGLGAAVLVAGYGLMSPVHSSAAPSVTFGCVSACKTLLQGRHKTDRNALGHVCASSSRRDGRTFSASLTAQGSARLLTRGSAASLEQDSLPLVRASRWQGYKQQLHTAPSQQGQACTAHGGLAMRNCCKADACSGLASDCYAAAAIITDAQVVPGSSGAGLFAADALGQDERPLMVGLVTSNARLDHGAAIPSVGYVLPMAQLRPILNVCAELAAGAVSEKQATAALQHLDVPEPELDRLWGTAVGTNARWQSRSRL